MSSFEAGDGEGGDVAPDAGEGALIGRVWSR
jgi:hypothetical protein